MLALATTHCLSSAKQVWDLIALLTCFGQCVNLVQSVLACFGKSASYVDQWYTGAVLLLQACCVAAAACLIHYSTCTGPVCVHSHVSQTSQLHPRGQASLKKHMHEFRARYWVGVMCEGYARNCVLFLDHMAPGDEINSYFNPC